MQRDLRKRIIIIPDLTPAHKNAKSGVHGISAGTKIDSVSDREDSVGNLAFYVAALVKILINAEIIDRDFPSEEEDLTIQDILEALEEMSK